MIGTPRPATVFTKQQRIAELARNGPEMAFTTLAHHIEAWFKRRSQLRGGWGRRPKGDAPRSAAGALGARSLLPARPQPPRSCHPRRSGS